MMNLQFFAHTLYDNFVIEHKMTDLVNTNLDARGLMTLDYSLAEAAGLKKSVLKYTYTGKVEKLVKGAKNSSKGTVAYVKTDYTVGRYQQTFVYNDMDVMQDPYILDVASTGAAAVMANEIKTEYFAELAKIENSHTYASAITYNTVVDALAKINQEVEEGMFLIMNNKQRAEIRKDPDFKTSRQGEILYSGQFGTVAGLPVLFSKLVPTDTVYITNREAVKFFVKREGRVEQDHDIETKDNTVVYDRVGLVALVDETKSVKITKAM